MKVRVLHLLLIGVCLCMSCAKSGSRNVAGKVIIKGQPPESAIIEEVQSSNVEDCYKYWKADNPQCKAEFMDDLDYNTEHKLKVRMYSERPDEDDYVADSTAYETCKMGHYIIYSRWRGDVYAYDSVTEKYYVVWHDLLHYNNKKIVPIKDGWIKIIYIEFSDTNNMTDAVMYNLESHKYYYTRTKNVYM